MAFNMKRPIIKGTSLHKASIAKAKSQSVVAQTRTQADSSLVGAGDALGKSYIPAAIDFSIDQKAIKIPESKKEKKKGGKEIDVADLLIEDEDVVEDAGLDDEVAVNPNEKDRGYKNWKVREEEENIRLAEENKARLDAASAKRDRDRAAKLKADAEAKKNNTNMDFTTKNPDIVMPEDKPFKPNPKSDIRVMSKKELDAAQEKTINREALITREEAGDATGNKAKGKLVNKTEEELVIEAEVKAKTAETLRVETERQAKLEADKIAADKAKQEEIAKKKAKKDEINLKNEAIRERNAAKIYFKGKTNQPKSIDDKVKALREMKAAQKAELNSTPIEIPEQDDPEPWEIAAQEKRDLNSNTPQNAPEQPERKGVEEDKPKESSGKQKRLDLKYKLAGPSVRANMEADGYTPPKSKSPMEMRDDRIYRNARADGPVRKNMIKGGYKPQN